MSANKAPKNFEAAMQRLEEIASALEAGDLSLEESLRMYEEGMELTRYCESKLNDAERRLKRLTKKGDAFQLELIE